MTTEPDLAERMEASKSIADPVERRNVQEALVREYEELVGYAAETERDMEFFKSKIHTHLARLDKILRGEKP
jgi:hypothetical protein